MQQKEYNFWFLTGSQNLYGSEPLNTVEKHSKKIVESLHNNKNIGADIIFKQVVKTPDEIRKICLQANSDDNCAGIITWMHTFSPSKMWIQGLSEIHKPILHLHTQYNRDIPWENIDMDYMNLNQSAHGGREYGFIGSRMNISRKVVAGHWKDPELINRINSSMQSAIAFIESRNLKIARFGDNMREVAVTEGDKVEAQIKFGWSTNGYGVGDLVERVNEISQTQINRLIEEYKSSYHISKEIQASSSAMESIEEQAGIELGMESFLVENGFSAFTTTFEDLNGLKQLPGLAVQHLMSKGYGFGAEGDWKTAGLVRLMKIMGSNTRTSFMEDYTYHFEPGNELVLGAHMLEVCPTISSDQPRIEVHQLGIGGKKPPARLVFDGSYGPAVNASLIDMGNRFRLIINKVDAVENTNKMPELPVANLLWRPRPSLKEAAEAWIMAGGAHHTCFSFEVTCEQLIDWAEMVGIEVLLINEDTKLYSFKNEIRWNDVYWKSKT